MTEGDLALHNNNGLSAHWIVVSRLGARFVSTSLRRGNAHNQWAIGPDASLRANKAAAAARGAAARRSPS